MLELSPNDPLIKTYLKDLQHLKSQSVTHELGLKGPFQTLLDKAAKRRGWTLVPELSTYSGGKRVVPDGTVRDEFRLARGWWEAKDTSDKLAAEIQKKLKAGYPARNTIFEDTQTAVLYQDRGEAGEFALGDRGVRLPPRLALGTGMGHRPVSGEGRERPQSRGRSRLYRAPGRPSGARQHRNRTHRQITPELPLVGRTPWSAADAIVRLPATGEGARPT